MTGGFIRVSSSQFTLISYGSPKQKESKMGQAEAEVKKKMRVTQLPVFEGYK